MHFKLLAGFLYNSVEGNGKNGSINSFVFGNDYYKLYFVNSTALVMG